MGRSTENPGESLKAMVGSIFGMQTQYCQEMQNLEEETFIHDRRSTMNNQLKIATVRGAGLAFPLACLWYVYSGSLSVFSLILLGGGIGFLFGLLLKQRSVMQTQSAVPVVQTFPVSDRKSKLMEYLSHPNALVRFGSLIAVGTVIFLLAWCIGYYLLPEGTFHSGADAHMARAQLTGQAISVFEEWTRIFGANLLVALIILLGSFLIKVNGLSFGYFAFFYNVIGYGLFIGTNSFAIPYPERLAPSFEILSRGGPYEMLALALLAVASYFWPLFQVKRIFFTGPERVESPVRFSWKDAIWVVLGLCILMAANWIEATMVVSA